VSDTEGETSSTKPATATVRPEFAGAIGTWMTLQ
jgi:hypothetical protein